MYIRKEQLQIKETCVSRKDASTELYIYWNAHLPVEWKVGTLRYLVKRAETVCSTMLVHQEIEHLKAVISRISRKLRTSLDTQITEHS